MPGVDVTGMEGMWTSTLTGILTSITTLIAASTRTGPEPGLGRVEGDRADRESGNITRNTGRELRTAIKRRHSSITEEDLLMQRSRGMPSGAVRNTGDRTFPKAGQVNSAARVASSGPEIEPRGARPVAKAFNMEGATVLLEEAKAVAKRDNRAAVGVRAVRARVQGVEVEVVVAVVEVEAEAAAVAVAEVAEVVAAVAADRAAIIDTYNLKSWRINKCLCE